MKQTYIDLINLAVSAYTVEHIRTYTEEVRTGGLTEHGYPRLTANIGFLLSQGMRPDLRELFTEMMELTCSEFQTAMKKSLAKGKRAGIGNDFAVKEIVLMLVELEKAGTFPKAQTDHWREMLAVLKPLETYTCIAAVPPVAIGNWAAFAAASEQVRLWAGIGGETDENGRKYMPAVWSDGTKYDFIENQIQSQLFSFDENGMYRDPNEPMVYDMVTRLQLAIALWCGYDGAGRAELVKFMKLSARPTLLMQSVSGEIPFGGRSNQFLHNDTFLAALCEFYATWYKQMGDLETAGQFKAAARLACESMRQWLYGETHHIKNRFPLESKIGCEGYGYFNKYMVTMGSWAYLGYLFSDDTVQEYPCPIRQPAHAFKTSDYFHKLFLHVGGYGAEFELNADPHYDASGLGRLHKVGTPSAICLSVPFAVHPLYTLPQPNPMALSLSPCLCVDGKAIIPDRWEVEKYSVDTAKAVADLTATLNGRKLHEHFTLTGAGASIETDAEAVALPIFLTDGEEKTEITATADSVTVAYRSHKVTYTADSIEATETECVNRNGIYRLYLAKGKVSIVIE